MPLVDSELASEETKTGEVIHAFCHRRRSKSLGDEVTARSKIAPADIPTPCRESINRQQKNDREPFCAREIEARLKEGCWTTSLSEGGRPSPNDKVGDVGPGRRCTYTRSTVPLTQTRKLRRSCGN